jgi:hypothetical protein
MGWSKVSKQGEIDIGVGAADRSALIFTCPEQWPGQKVGISVHVRGHFPEGDKNTLKITVGQQNFTFRLKSESVVASDRTTETSVKATADALLGSSSRTFVAEIPELHWQQEFSLANVKTAMGGGPGKNIISRCRP